MTTCEVKYAPTDINDVVFNNTYYEQQIKLIFQGFKTRNLFFSGTNATGKTTLANLIANELTKHCSYLLLDESIEHVMSQGDIYAYFMRIRTTAGVCGSGSDDRVVVVFNELDKFTGSLDHLWTVMDRMKEDLLVIITTNYPMKFENAIRSRCDKYDFTRITPEQFLSRAQFILDEENLVLNDADVLHCLKSMSVKTSDVRDYLAILDKLIFMDRNRITLPIAQPPNAIQHPFSPPILSVVK